MRKTLLILAVLLTAAAPGSGSFRYYRSYQPGDVYLYNLTVTQDIDGKFDTEESVDSRHVVFGGQANGDEITFENLNLRDHEGPKDLSALAQKVPPIRFSLDSGWRNRVPSINVPAMRGAILDMYTFYEAIGSGSGIRRLQRAGDVQTSNGIRRTEWSDSRFVPVAEDCTTLTLFLNSANAEAAKVSSDFQPPPDPCVQMQRPWMNAPVDGKTPNNFQIVRRDTDGYTVIWGRKSVTVETTIDVQSGAIRTATMDATMQVRMRQGCDANFDACQPQKAFVIHRKGTLHQR